MKQFFSIILLLLVCTVVDAKTEWKLKRDEDGIRVYTANQENSEFKSVKVECTINATTSQLIAFLLDIDKQPEWVYHAQSSQLVKKVGPNEILFYSEVSVPWPCSNRDYISHFKVMQAGPQLVIIDCVAEPAQLPEKPGKVRVKLSDAHWEITPIGSGSVSVVYTLQFDPGGGVPAWLTNLFMTKGPFETFQKLRTGVDKPAYKGAHFDFVKN